MNAEEIKNAQEGASARLMRYQVEEREEWMKWVKEMPYLHFKSSWEVQVIPPFGGALARFVVRLKDAPDTWISIYFDPHCNLGYMKGPYWEVYPIGEDTERWLVGEEQEMIESIHKELLKQKRK